MTTQPIRWTLAALVTATCLLPVSDARPFGRRHGAGREHRHPGFRQTLVRSLSELRKEPTFSVFRLTEPFRVLLDVNNAEDGAARSSSRRSTTALIRYVSTTQFADEGSSILRVEVALDETAPYSARVDGNAVVLTVGSDKAAAGRRPRPGRAGEKGAPDPDPKTRLGQGQAPHEKPRRPAPDGDERRVRLTDDRLTHGEARQPAAGGHRRRRRIDIARSGSGSASTATASRTARVADKNGSVRYVLDLQPRAQPQGQASRRLTRA